MKKHNKLSERQRERIPFLLLAAAADDADPRRKTSCYCWAGMGTKISSCCL
jgi:hypothetical protein